MKIQAMVLRPKEMAQNETSYHHPQYSSFFSPGMLEIVGKIITVEKIGSTNDTYQYKQMGRGSRYAFREEWLKLNLSPNEKWFGSLKGG
jgi:hypothetical protein